MPLPKPKIGETKETFLERCLTQIAGEFPDEKQRLAVWQCTMENSSRKHI